MSQKLLPRDAVDWLVLQESGWAEGRDIAQLWEAWCADSNHRAEYVFIKQFARDLRKLPPPRLPTRRELIADAAAERGKGSFH